MLFQSIARLIFQLLHISQSFVFSLLLLIFSWQLQTSAYAQSPAPPAPPEAASEPQAPSTQQDSPQEQLEQRQSEEEILKSTKKICSQFEVEVSPEHQSSTEICGINVDGVFCQVKSKSVDEEGHVTPDHKKIVLPVETGSLGQANMAISIISLIFNLIFSVFMMAFGNLMVTCGFDVVTKASIGLFSAAGSTFALFEVAELIALNVIKEELKAKYNSDKSADQLNPKITQDEKKKLAIYYAEINSINKKIHDFLIAKSVVVGTVTGLFAAAMTAAVLETLASGVAASAGLAPSCSAAPLANSPRRLKFLKKLKAIKNASHLESIVSGSESLVGSLIASPPTRIILSAAGLILSSTVLGLTIAQTEIVAKRIKNTCRTSALIEGLEQIVTKSELSGGHNSNLPPISGRSVSLGNQYSNAQATGPGQACICHGRDGSTPTSSPSHCARLGQRSCHNTPRPTAKALSNFPGASAHLAGAQTLSNTLSRGNLGSLTRPGVLSSTLDNNKKAIRQKDLALKELAKGPLAGKIKNPEGKAQELLAGLGRKASKLLAKNPSAFKALAKSGAFQSFLPLSERPEQVKGEAPRSGPRKGSFAAPKAKSEDSLQDIFGDGEDQEGTQNFAGEGGEGADKDDLSNVFDQYAIKEKSISRSTQKPIWESIHFRYRTSAYHRLLIKKRNQK